MVRYSIRNPSGAVVIDLHSINALNGYLGVVLPDGGRTKIRDAQALYLCAHGWTLHATYGMTTHQLSDGSLTLQRTRGESTAAPSRVVRADQAWRVAWTSEAVALEFAEFRRPEDVARAMRTTRAAVYAHLKRLAKTYVVEQRKIGFVEFKVTDRLVPNYDPSPGKRQPTAETPRTTYAELQERLKRDGHLPADVVAV